jgi:hypothetical protein
MQFVYAKVYLIADSVDSRYRMLRAVILLAESVANKWTNLGISLAFSIDYLAPLSKHRL